jgi:hypothetical protein
MKSLAPLTAPLPKPLISFTVTTVRNFHLDGKVRATESFQYDADCAFTALRIWLQTNFANFNDVKGGILFLAIHPTADALESAKTETALLGFLKA